MKQGFEDRTDKVRKAIDDSVAIGLTECAVQLEGEIARRTPVDTGHLRNSISFIAPRGKSPDEEGSDRLSGKQQEKAAYVGTNVEYAEYVEYGTKRVRAQPYMRTGLAAAAPALREIFRRRMMADGK